MTLIDEILDRCRDIPLIETPDNALNYGTTLIARKYRFRNTAAGIWIKILREPAGRISKICKPFTAMDTVAVIEYTTYELQQTVDTENQNYIAGVCGVARLEPVRTIIDVSEKVKPTDPTGVYCIKREIYNEGIPECEHRYPTWAHEAADWIRECYRYAQNTSAIDEKGVITGE